LIIVAIPIDQKLSLYVNCVYRFPEHAHADVGEDPKPEIEHIPIHLRKAQDNDRQMVEVGELQAGRIVLLPCQLDIEAVLQHKLNENTQNEQCCCQQYE
jgi:hypothetical protein